MRPFGMALGRPRFQAFAELSASCPRLAVWALLVSIAAALVAPRGAEAQATLPESVPDLLAGPASPVELGVLGENVASTGAAIGLQGTSSSPLPGSVGLVGEAAGVGGVTVGGAGLVASPQGIGGRFEAPAGGFLLRGWTNGVEVFSIDGAGEVRAVAFEGDGRALSSYPDLACQTACVDGLEIGPDAIGINQLGNDSVATSKLQAGAVGISELSPGAVTSAKIADGAVTSAKLATGAVQGSKLADDAVQNHHFSAGAVTSSKISGSVAIGGAKLNGQERQVYVRLAWCVRGGELTTAATCQTEACSSGTFYPCCNGFCNCTESVTCNNVRAFNVLAPEIAP